MAFIPGAVALASAASTSVTMAGAMIASTAATVIGGGMSAYGMIQQGRAAKAEADYTAKTHENNALSAGYAAIQEQQAAQREVENVREGRLRNLSTQRVSAANSGLTISGSVVDTMGDSAIQAEREADMLMYRGRMGAYNSGQQAANYRAQGVMSRMSGRSSRRAANLSAGATLLSSAASAGMGYAGFKKT